MTDSLSGSGILSRDESEAVARKVLSLSTAPAIIVMVASRVSGSTDFSRNQVESANDRQSLRVAITATFGTRSAAVYTNHLDEAGLKAAVAKGEAIARAESVPQEVELDPPGPVGPVNPAIWHDGTLGNLDPATRFGAVKSAIDAVERAGQLGAGNLVTVAETVAVLTRDGHFEFGRSSTSTYTLTARTSDGTGSGWAGWRGEDWAKADPSAMAEHAVDLARRTQNPVAIEPGRYTVVMSPVALGALMSWIGRKLDGELADEGISSYSIPGGGTKIGLKVFDERVTLLADPMDPDGGFVPFEYDKGEFEQFEKVTWVENGILKNLSYDAVYAKMHGKKPLRNSGSLRMVGGPTSVDEMIASTRRGVYVSRFSDVRLASFKSLLLTGVTRDGTFLIENGQITRPIKNCRFYDSPLFFLNNLEALGPIERVPVGFAPCVVPSAKVRDFNFTSLSDAI